MAILQQFGILFSLGSAGILLSTILFIPTLEREFAALPVNEVPPLWVPLVLIGFQSAVLLAISIFVGIFCTRSVGLRSHLIDYWVFHSFKSIPFVTELKWSLGIGAITTVITFILNHWMEPLLPQALRDTSLQSANSTGLHTLAGILYGGITEELLMRWGLMSLLVWLGWKFLKQGVALPSHSIYQGAITLAAVVFGLLHLPYMATMSPLTTWVILRVVLLNGIAGIGFGWLFWQYSLEAAMVAHASFHVFLFLGKVMMGLNR